MNKEHIFIIVAFVTIIIIIFVGGFYALSFLQHYTLKNACETWEIESERESKFVSNYPWYADCLTKTESGWISAMKLNQLETPDLK